MKISAMNFLYLLLILSCISKFNKNESVNNNLTISDYKIPVFNEDSIVKIVNNDLIIKITGIIESSYFLELLNHSYKILKSITPLCRDSYSDTIITYISKVDTIEYLSSPCFTRPVLKKLHIISDNITLADSIRIDMSKNQFELKYIGHKVSYNIIGIKDLEEFATYKFYFDSNKLVMIEYDLDIDYLLSI